MYKINIKIKKIRNNNGLNQSAFGRMLGISQTAVAKLEDGRSTPNIRTMLKLWKLFNYDPRDQLEDFQSDHFAEQHCKNPFSEDQNSHDQ